MFSNLLNRLDGNVTLHQIASDVKTLGRNLFLLQCFDDSRVTMFRIIDYSRRNLTATSGHSCVTNFAVTFVLISLMRTFQGI